MRWSSLTLSLAATLLPATTRAEPAGDYEYDRINAPVFGTSALVFTAAYLPSVIVAGTGDASHQLYVPLVGPWLALSDRPSCDVTSTACDHETTTKVMLVADGILQAVGLLGMLDGVLEPSRHRRGAYANTKLRVRPVIVGEQNPTPGLGVSGHF